MSLMRLNSHSTLKKVLHGAFAPIFIFVIFETSALFSAQSIRASSIVASWFLKKAFGKM
jgi:hypothetical protein